MSDDDYSRLIYLHNHRGHAHAFVGITPEEKADVELDTAQDWGDSIREVWGLDVTEFRSNPDDPPDCFARFERRDISVELTELVDGETLARIAQSAKRGIAENTYHGEAFVNAQWSEARFRDTLGGLIARKSDRYARNAQEIDALVVYTHETWLFPQNVADWLVGWEPEPTPCIGSIYLLMDRQPGGPDKPRHRPLFRVSGGLD